MATHILHPGDDLKSDASISKKGTPEEQIARLTKQLEAAKSLAKRDAEQLTQLQNLNLQLLDRQKEEKQVRAQLSSAVQTLRKENAFMLVDTAKYKELYTEIETKLRIETDMFEKERSEWKKHQLKALKKFEAEVENSRLLQRRADELANTLMITTDEKTKAELARDSHKRQLEESVVNKQKIKLQNRELAATTSSNATEEALKVKNQQQADQLRKMAEKVFALVAQINQMEEWKVAQLEAEKVLKTNIVAIEASNEQMDSSLRAAVRKYERLESANRLLQEKLLKQQRIVMQVKQDQHLLEKERHNLNRTLRLKDNQLQQTSGRTDALSHRLLAEQSSRLVERETLAVLQNETTELKDHNSLLRSKLDQVENEKVSLARLVQQQEEQLAGWQARQTYFDNLQASLVERSKVDLQQAVLLASGDAKSEVLTLRDVDSTERTGGSHEPKNLKARLRRALRSKEGKYICGVLNRLLVDPEQLFVWIKQPNQLVDGLADTFRKLKAQYQVVVPAFEDKSAKPSAASGARNDDAMRRAIQKKCDELVIKVHVAEGAKTKATFRLISLITKFANAEMSNSGGGASTTFLTAVQDEEEADAKNAQSEDNLLMLVKKRDEEKEALRDVFGGSYVRLNDQEMDDADATELVELVKIAKRVTELDLHNNNVTEKGAFAIIEAALPASSALTKIDLRHNQVSLVGLEKLSQLLLSLSQPIDGMVPLVQSACLQKDSAHFLPILEIQLQRGRTLLVDLRHNSLQKGHSQTAIKQSMARVVASLAQCGNVASTLTDDNKVLIDAGFDEGEGAGKSNTSRVEDLFGVDGDETGSGPEVKERGLVSSDNTQNLQAFDDVLRKSRSVRKRYAQARSGLERTVQSKSAINLPKVAKEKSQMYESAHSLSLRVLPNKNDLVGSAMNKSKSVAKLKGVYGGSLPGLDTLFVNVNSNVNKKKSQKASSQGSWARSKSAEASRLKEGTQRRGSNPVSSESGGEKTISGKDMDDLVTRAEALDITSPGKL